MNNGTPTKRAESISELTTIRELLFGEFMKSVDKRLERLENLIEKNHTYSKENAADFRKGLKSEIKDVRSNFDAQIAEIHDILQKRTKELDNRITEENTDIGSLLVEFGKKMQKDNK